MYVLKHLPEDFVVEEMADFETGEEGPYLLLRVTKRKRNTEEVARLLAKAFHVDRKAVGYAGAKDRNALTTQHFTVKGKRKEEVAEISFEGISLEALGCVDQPLALGLHWGNRFTIMVRNLAGDEELSLPAQLPNYFDEQRFSNLNARIGEALVRKEFRRAAELLSSQGGREAEAVALHLRRHENDFVGAVRRLPRQLLRLHLHAFQSRLWNELLVRYVERHAYWVDRVAYSQGMLAFPVEEARLRRRKAKNNSKNNSKNDEKNNTSHNIDYIENKQLPLPGFANEVADPEIALLTEEILRMNGLSPQDFVIRQLPNLSLEGASRQAFMEVVDYSCDAFAEDEQFPGKKKAVLRFTLAKGSYATMLVKALLV